MGWDIFKKYNIRAKKGLWQNFLQDDFILNEIAKSVKIEGRNIVEIGPGYWALTEKILEQEPKNLDLVELDIQMVKILKSRIENKDFHWENTRLEIHHIDVLKYQPVHTQYDVIANIPYYITSPILRYFLYEIENKPKHMVILMQEDVGNKILGKWKNKSSVLSLFIEKKSEVSEIIKVPKECFIPTPKIESSVLFFESHNLYDDINDENFLAIIKKWFAEPRKKLSNNLIKWGYSREKITQLFENLEFWINTRGEDLDIGQWIEIVKILG